MQPLVISRGVPRALIMSPSDVPIQTELAIRPSRRSYERIGTRSPRSPIIHASASSFPTNDPDRALEEGRPLSQSPEASALEASQEIAQQDGLWAKIKYSFTRGKLDKERLKQLGVGAFASYSFVSNSTYGPGLVLSWIAFMKKTGKSPLQSGQWKVFLAFFAGFWTIQHFLRPLRFTLAIAMAPAFDRLITKVENWTGLRRRSAFVLYLIVYCILNLVFVFGSIFLLGGPKAFAHG